MVGLVQARRDRNEPRAHVDRLQWLVAGVATDLEAKLMEADDHFKRA